MVSGNCRIHRTHVGARTPGPTHYVTGSRSSRRNGRPSTMSVWNQEMAASWDSSNLSRITLALSPNLITFISSQFYPYYRVRRTLRMCDGVEMHCASFLHSCPTLCFTCSCAGSPDAPFFFFSCLICLACSVNQCQPYPSLYFSIKSISAHYNHHSDKT